MGSKTRPSQRRRQYVAVFERHLPTAADCGGHRRCRATARRRVSRFLPRQFDRTENCRTHLQDATPLTVGQEFSGYVALLDADLARPPGLARITRTGHLRHPRSTGLNAHSGIAERAARRIAELTANPLCASQQVAALSAHDELVMASGALKTLAAP